MPEDVPLREHLEARIDAAERQLEARIDAVSAASNVATETAKEAVAKAEAATERRLEGLNELRAMVSDYQRDLLPRSEADSMIGNIQDRIDRLEKAHTTQTGRATGLAAGWAYLIAAVGLVGVVIAILVAAFG